MIPLDSETRSRHAENQAAFLALSGKQIAAHDGEYALFVGGQLLGFYPTNKEAIQSALAQGYRGRFSVMAVRPSPEDMGFFLSANYPG